MLVIYRESLLDAQSTKYKIFQLKGFSRLGVYMIALITVFVPTYSI